MVTFENDDQYAHALAESTTDFLNTRIINAAIDQEKYPQALEKAVVTTIQNSDLVLIDGGNRNICMALASRYLHDGGIIVVDNSDRTEELAAGLRTLNGVAG